MKPGRTLVIAIDGIAGSGKSTAGKIIAEEFGGTLIAGDKLMFKFMEGQPKLMETIYGHPMDDMSGRDYLHSYLKRPEQLIKMISWVNPHIENHVHEAIHDAKRNKKPVVIYEGGACSTMNFWTNEPDTVKIIVKADSEKLIKAFAKRENEDLDLPRIIEEALKRVIRPHDADFIIHNQHDGIDKYKEYLLDVCNQIRKRIINLEQTPGGKKRNGGKVSQRKLSLII